ncbi:hypothetical protein FRC12_005346 [Ceratobasidium sp. 428]|nr:hypothetical protein FRC12_005346 [Ceratobasidium sp. 428]
MTIQIENIYKNILNDPRKSIDLNIEPVFPLKRIISISGVRAAVDSIARHFPRAPFVAIVIGTGAASEPATFILFPLLGLVPGAAAAGSLAGLVKSALKGRPIAPGDISGILQLLGAAVSGGLPPLIVGAMVDGVVQSVRATKGSKQAKELGEGGEKKGAEDVGTEGKSVNDGAGGEELVALNGASAVIVPVITAVEGNDLAEETHTPYREGVPSIEADTVLGITEKESETLHSNWVVTKTFSPGEPRGFRPKL